MNLEFFIKLREMVSSGLVKMADTAKKTTSAIKGSNDTLSMSYDTIKRKIGELESVISKSTSVKQIREARRELEQLQRIASKAPGNIDRGGGGGALMGFVRQYVGPLAIAGGLAGIFSAGAKQEQNLVGLRTFLGQQGAEQVYKNIKQDAATSPFGVESLLMVNRALISAGVNADNARKDTMNLANAISAVGAGDAELSRMAVNMQQIKAVGKASAMDIKQFAFAGINIYEMLARATGKTVKQVKDMDVSYELLSFALDKAAKSGGMYAGALAAQGKTALGRWNQLKDEFALGAADLGTALMPLIHGLLDVGMAIATTVVPAAIQMVNWTKENWNWISILAVGLGAAASAYYAYTFALRASTIGTQVMTAAQRVLNWVMRLNPVGIVISALAALVAVVIYAWNKFTPFRATVLATWEVLKGFGDMIKTAVVDRFYALLELAGALGNALKLLFKGEFGAAWDTTKAGIAAYNNATADSNKRVRAKMVDAGRNALTTFASEMKKGDAGAEGAGGGSLGDVPRPSAINVDDTAKSIASGGPRIININGVKFLDKLADKLEINNQGDMNAIEVKLEEMFLRLLNSGAKVSG